MNLDENRKAFVEHYEKAHGNAYYDADVGFVAGEFVNPVTQAYWETWLASKAYQEEMAKPTCEIYRTLVTGGLYEYCPTTTTQGFATEAEALEWAKENGYRVQK